MNSELLNLNAPILFFPVRHHSPSAAKCVRILIQSIQPAAVLIEGPFDFNSRLDELKLPHQLPIAIYSYTQLADGTRRGAFYPFCIYSPEWQAIQTANELNIPIRFIDLPWTKIATPEMASHRYADGQLRQSQYVSLLCKKLGVEDFDTLWDTLFEIDDSLTVNQYLERCHHFCFHLRSMDELDQKISAIDLQREAFMVAQIRQAHTQYSGQLLVVTGGFHSSALHQTLSKDTLGIVPEPLEHLLDSEGGIALTPYSYERLDNLTGYESGMPNPGFYHQVWQQYLSQELAQELSQELAQDTTSKIEPYRQLLIIATQALRHQNQVVSSADLIAVETLARGLAIFRNHARIWRQDLIDGIIGALVKEELDHQLNHPFLLAIYQSFRGDERGVLADGTQSPPLVQELRILLEKYQLELTLRAEKLNLDLYNSSDLVRSQILHQLKNLGIIGYSYTGGTDLLQRKDLSQIHEQWLLCWSPDFEASCIEAAIYGATLADSTIAKLKEKISTLERNAAAAAVILVNASLMGLATKLEDCYSNGYSNLIDIIRADSNFFTVTQGLGHLLYLYSYNDIFQTQGDAKIGQLLTETFQRGLWLLENLGRVQDRDPELLKGLKTLLETFERCSRVDQRLTPGSEQSSIQLDRDFLIEVLYRTSVDQTQTPLLRGASTGAIWALAEVSTETVKENLDYFSDPDQLGDFLTGFFGLAREIVQRHPDLMMQLNQFILDYDDEEFLAGLPGLRLAFSYFTPREKYHIARTLLQSLKLDTTQLLPELDVSPETAAQMVAFETEIFQALQKYGLRSSVNAGQFSLSSTLQRQSTSKPSPSDPLINLAPNAANASQVTFDEQLCKLRWRLILGNGTESFLGATLEGLWAQRDCALGFLYDREYGSSQNVRPEERRGGQEEAQLTVPDWINAVHELFPQQTIERLEKDAVERYKLEEIVTNPEVLQRVQPNQTLLKAILRTKHLMNQEVLTIARQLVRKVVDQLMEKLARPIQSPFLGAVNRQQRSLLKVAKNFDVKTTIRRNLKFYDPTRQKLYLQTPYFYSRIRRQVDRWQIIILVDESGSMLESVIHSAITASIFFGLKSVRTHLCLFDTSVVDLTESCNDPVEAMMKVQLGGGTDIGQALAYADQLIDNPRRTIIVLITDFFEGAPVNRLLSVTQQLVESGVNLLGLAALDGQANPCYDLEIASQMVALGAQVGAMTPGELAEWVAQKVR
ncbi:MAG: DUF5682 family protein [Microcoleaceae cyanobacterium]